MDELRAAAVLIVVCAIYLGAARRPWAHAAQLALAACALVLFIRWARELVRPWPYGLADAVWPAVVVFVVWGVVRVIRMVIDRCSTHNRAST
jgi:hypothetical protein